MKQKTKKIDMKRLLAKALEDGIKKTVEILILAFALGATFKAMSITIPAVMTASIIARVIKLGVLKH